MLVLINCSTCGIIPSQSFFSGFGSVTITNSLGQCPSCGKPAPVLDGTYEYIGQAIRAIISPGVTQFHLISLKEIATRVKSGAVAPDEYDAEITSLPAPLVALFALARQNAGLLGLLIAAVGLYLQIY